MAVALFFCSLQSQELSRSVFASSGETATNGNLKLSWTIGQSGLVGSFTQPSLLTLNVGFQQFDNLGVYVAETKNHEILQVFPNPFSDAFYINMKSERRGKLDYYLYDNNGKIVLQANGLPVESDNTGDEVELPNRPPGIYNLTIFFFPEHDSPTQLSIKLIKL